MSLCAKSMFAFGLVASLSTTSAQAFQVATLAPSDTAVAKVDYYNYYGAPSYGYGYRYGYRPSYGYRQSYGYRPSYRYRPSYGYGYNRYGY